MFWLSEESKQGTPNVKLQEKAPLYVGASSTKEGIDKRRHSHCSHCDCKTVAPPSGSDVRSEDRAAVKAVRPCVYTACRMDWWARSYSTDGFGCIYFVYLVNSVVKYRTSTVKQKATYEECLKLDDSANDNLDLASLRLLIWT